MEEDGDADMAAAPADTAAAGAQLLGEARTAEYDAGAARAAPRRRLEPEEPEDPSPWSLFGACARARCGGARRAD
jgi:hypothetical protein